MRCPFCDSEKVRVIDSREMKEQFGIRRRRECSKCHKRFTTYEFVQKTPVMIIKRDGRHEIFDKQKIIDGLLRASHKREIPRDLIENIANKVELKLQNSFKQEIEAEKIGKMVLKELEKIDEVAYIRFLSVYKHFKDLDQFYEKIEDFIKRKKRSKKK